MAVLGEYNQLVFDDAAQEWATHPSTTFEIKACCDDLKVLGRSDFKSMLKWRMGLRRERSKRLRDEAKAAESSDDEEDTGPVDPDADVDEALSKALRALQQKKRREKKKAKRKEMKQLERQAMGMNHQAVSLEEHESLFTLANIKTMKQLKEIGDVNLDDAGSDEFGQYLDSSASEDEAPRKKRINTASGAGGDSSDEEDYMKAIEAEMDHHYEEYKRRQAEKTHVMKTSLDGLSRKKLLLKKAQLKEMDFEGKLNKTHESYLKLLSGARVKAPTMEEEDEAAAEAAAQDSDDSDSEGNQSDGSNASEIAAIRQSQSKLARKRKTEGALIADLDDKIDPTVRSNRWFSQPMFEDMELEELQEDSRAKRAWSRDQRSAGQVALESSDEEEEEEETDAAAGGGSGGVYVLAPEILAKAKKAASASAKETAAQKAQRKKALAAAARISGINAEVESSDEDGEIAKMMKGLEPSEREKRKQKLRKVREREEAKSKKEKKMEIVAMEPSDSEVDEESGSDADENLPERKRQKQKEALIRAGMGAAVGGSDQDDDGEGFEVVAKPADIEAGQEADSDSEMDDSEGSDDDVSSVDPRDLDYDSETHAEILALGKKLKQHTEAKKLVDASYNRYCNNDEEMPHWFVADENRHWRPQLPITREEVNAMRDRVRDIAERPIKKVMEARMRKKKRAAMKLAKARKKAAAIADDDEIAAKSKEKVRLFCCLALSCACVSTRVCHAYVVVDSDTQCVQMPHVYIFCRLSRGYTDRPNRQRTAQLWWLAETATRSPAPEGGARGPRSSTWIHVCGQTHAVPSAQKSALASISAVLASHRRRSDDRLRYAGIIQVFWFVKTRLSYSYS